MKFKFCLLVTFFFLQLVKAQQQVTITVNASDTIGEMKPFWSFFGYDEPNYTTRANGKKLLKELKDLSPTKVYIRTHNLLTSKGNSKGPDLKWGFTDAYKEDANGNAVYNWITVDSIVDVFIKGGMKPLMEIGFMPEDLAAKPEPYEHNWSKGGNLWTGWTSPPKDYNKWRELIYQWVKHSIERYGKEEVTTWLWEVWNEPDIPYWSGSFDEYCKLYDYASDGLKKACSECTIGGPHTTSPRGDKGYNYLTKFIEHCLHGTNYANGKTGSPLGYNLLVGKSSPSINFRLYSSCVHKVLVLQLNLQAVNSFPELKNIPVIIGECDPEGCAACSEKREPRYAYRNGTVYSSYTAASFAKIYELTDKYKINLRGAVSWSFEFENQEWFAGFRDLATNGVDKPVLNIFRMFGKMEGQRVTVKSTNGVSVEETIGKGIRNNNDVNAIAGKSNNSIAAMVWNYNDADIKSEDAIIKLHINGLPKKKITIQHYRVDSAYSNSFEKWKAMGKPQQLTDKQFKELEKAGQLQEINMPVNKITDKGTVELNFNLPRQGVSLIKLTWN